MNPDAIHTLIVVALLIAVVAAIYGGLCLYEKITGKWPGNGSTSSSDSFNDINNSLR
jgi:hypothetical protein